jgi:hypothetical protein
MTIGEFKAFLEGMGLGDAPTPEQWARIVEKIKALEPFRAPTAQPNTFTLPSNIYVGSPTLKAADIPPNVTTC